MMYRFQSRPWMPAIGIMAFFLMQAPVRAADEAVDPILIGLDADISASSAIGGEAIRRGTIIAVDEVNRAGGVLGRPLDLVIRDHHGNPDRGVDNLHEFATMKKLIADLLCFARFGRSMEAGEPVDLNAIIADIEVGLADMKRQRKAWLVMSEPLPSVIAGRTVLSKIKGDRSLRSIPVIVMTNSDAKCDIDARYEMGANTYIQKPSNWQSFLEAMNRLKEYRFEITVLPRTEI